MASAAVEWHIHVLSTSSNPFARLHSLASAPDLSHTADSSVPLPHPTCIHANLWIGKPVIQTPACAVSSDCIPLGSGVQETCSETNPCNAEVCLHAHSMIHKSAQTLKQICEIQHEESFLVRLSAILELTCQRCLYTAESTHHTSKLVTWLHIF